MHLLLRLLAFCLWHPLPYLLAYATYLTPSVKAQTVAVSLVRLYDMATVIGRNDMRSGLHSSEADSDGTGSHRWIWIDLSHRGLTHVPEDVWRVQGAKYLNLGGNPITDLSPHIGELGQLEVLILSGTRLRQLPETLDQLHNLRYLEADDMCLGSFPSATTRMPKLRVLSLARNAIGAVDERWLEGSELCEVDLSGNFLSAIPEGLLAVSGLKVLRLAENDINALPGQLGRLQHLEVLDVSYNPVSGVADGALPTSLKSLFAYACPLPSASDAPALDRFQSQGIMRTGEQVDGHTIDYPDPFYDREYATMQLEGPLAVRVLQHCPASVLSFSAGEGSAPDGISGLSELRRLNLCGTRWCPSWDSAEFRHLQTLSLVAIQVPGRRLLRGVGELKHLTCLDIGDNDLTGLPAEVGKLRTLRFLDVSRNGIREFPAELGDLVRLVWLFANDAQLSRLPSNIGRLKRLQYLELARNSLRVLPPSVGELTDLLVLDLTDNELTTLPDELCSLEKLTLLHLRNNRISRLPANISSLGSLECVDLSGNPVPEDEKERLRHALPDTEWVF